MFISLTELQHGNRIHVDMNIKANASTKVLAAIALDTIHHWLRLSRKITTRAQLPHDA